MDDLAPRRLITGSPEPRVSFRLKAGLVFLAGTVCIGMAGCKHDSAKTAKMPARPPARVTTAAAFTQDVPVYLDEIGRIVATESVSIVPQVGGKIIAVHFKDGAFVHKGDLLFEIDPRPFQAELASAKAELEQNQAMLNLARGELERYGAAVAAAAVSKLEFDQKKNAVAVAEAKVNASQAAVETAALDLEYSKILSPIDGRTGARLVDPGNVVRANDQTLLVIQQLDPIYAEFTITENDLGTVRQFLGSGNLDLSRESGPRLKVEVTVPRGLRQDSTSLASHAGLQAEHESQQSAPRIGELTFLDNSVVNQTGTVRLRATLPNADGYFWPGQFVQVRLITEVLKDAVLIPTGAVQISQQGPYVYVISPDRIAELRPISPGQRHAEATVVREGLKAGEQVVITGHLTVQPTKEVQVVNDNASAPPAVAAKPSAQVSTK